MHRGAPPLTVVLNDRWRLKDDPLQWILQVRKGGIRSKASGWVGKAFCSTRTALLRNIRDLCGPVDPDALRVLNGLPKAHGLHAAIENKAR